MTGITDSCERPINYLRISLTDRCNLRCIYCMPPDGVRLISHNAVISYEEIITIVKAASELGISKVRLTGGEPLVRLGLPDLVRKLAEIDKIDDIALTTNGSLLSKYAEDLKSAGLNRVNVSLDTLKPEKFAYITRRNGLADTLAGIEAAKIAGLDPVKLNMVVIRSINDDEILDFAMKTIEEGWHVRFIEMMPVASNSSIMSKAISSTEIKQRIEIMGELEPYYGHNGNGPAKYFRFPQAKGTVGFISPISDSHFCTQCNKLRLTSDGKLRLCLLADEEIDLKQSLRDGASIAELKELIREAIANKPSRHHLAEGYEMEKRPFSQIGG